jgi:hypothetical protein
MTDFSEIAKHLDAVVKKAAAGYAKEIEVLIDRILK